MPERQESGILDLDLLATWNVSGATFTEMYDAALRDAEKLMTDNSSFPYRVFVCYAMPMKYDSQGPDSAVIEWKGTAVVRKVIVPPVP